MNSSNLNSQLIESIKTFYDPSTPTQLRTQTAKQLEHFQNSRAAWNASVSLITPPADSTINTSFLEGSIFAAQTLKHKIIYDYRQLDQPAISSLRDSLWHLIFTHQPSPPKPVLIQLKLALAALVVQMPSDLWVDPVASCLTLLHDDSMVRLTDILDFLALIPEQLVNPAINTQLLSNPILYANQKERLLEKHVDSVISLSLQSIQTPSSLSCDSSNIIAVLSCIASWIRYGGDGSHHLSSTSLLTSLFGLFSTTLSSPDFDDDSLQIVDLCCCEVLNELSYRISRGIEDSSNDSTWFNQVNNHWIPLFAHYLSLLKDPLLISLSSPQDSPISQSARPLLTVICDFCEAFLPSLSLLPSVFNPLIESILLVPEHKPSSSAQSYQIIELTFNFWSSLASTSFHSDPPSAHIQIFSRLFSALVKYHLSFPVGQDATPESIDSFRDFRHIVGDCLKECVRVLNSSESLSLLLSLLESNIQVGSREGVEACLFALRTISSVIDRHESEILPLIVPLLSSLPQSFPDTLSSPAKILPAVLLNIGCYSDWLFYHSEHLSTFLSILSFGLNSTLTDPPLPSNSSSISAAMQSLKYLAESCSQHLQPHLDSLISLFQLAYPHSALSIRDRHDLTEALSLVLTYSRNSRNFDYLKLLLNLICSPLTLPSSDSLKISDSLLDYSIVLECSLSCFNLSDQTFTQLFLPSLPTLFKLFLSFACDPSPRFSDSFLKLFRVILNNTNPSLNDTFVNDHLLPFLLSPETLKFQNTLQSCAHFYSSILNLLSFTISSQLFPPSSHFSPLLLSQVPHFLSSAPSFNDDETFSLELFNFLRTLIVFNFPFSGWLDHAISFTYQLLTLRSLSPPEIVSISSFLAAAISSPQIDWLTPQSRFNSISLIVALILKSALLDWPLSNIIDLSLIFSRLSRNPTLSPLISSIFSSSSTLPINQVIASLFPPETTTSAELSALNSEYQSALSEASTRPKALRQFLKSVADICRRRQDQIITA